jgi:hypothetical protein
MPFPSFFFLLRRLSGYENGENQERVLNETHLTAMEELALVKEELQLAREERTTVQELVE